MNQLYDVQVAPARPASGSVPDPTFLSRAQYSFLQGFIYSESGIVVEADKHYLLEARLLPIVRSNQIESLDKLSVLLAKKSSPQLSKLVIDAMTTNETLFFRDTAMFEGLRTQVLPKIFERAARTGKVRIWSAASSSGQEAYSLAMMLLEMGKSKADVEIVGTDLSTQVIERARQGRYVQFEVGRGLPMPYLLKYFNKVGLDWQLKDEVRSIVRFEQMDLRHDFRFLGRFDLVLCRNVLIYFDTETKRKILGGIKSVLAPGGTLVLGCAETVINLHADFRRTLSGASTFYSL